MQCYTLSTTLKKMLPDHTVEVINYSSKNMVEDYKSSLVKRILGNKRTNGSKAFILIAKRFVKFVFGWRKSIFREKHDKNIMQKFEEMWSFLPLSSEELVSDDPEKFSDFINKGNYDVIIVGSDAIWNDNQTASPNKFLLHDIKKCVKLSYAASTYGMDFSNKTEEEIQYVNDSLDDFYFVGVRDSVTAEYVSKCTHEKVKTSYTCDPSLILNLEDLPTDTEKLKNKLKDKGIDLDRPIIGLMCSGWLAKSVRDNLGKGFQYVSVYHYSGFEDVILDDLNPFEWARVFSLFDATFTHYFHGTMFSLKNGTLTFAVEKKSSYKQKYITKIQDALQKMKLYESCYYEYEELNERKWSEIKEKIRENNKEKTLELYKQAIKNQENSFEKFFIKVKEVCGNGAKKGA